MIKRTYILKKSEQKRLTLSKYVVSLMRSYVLIANDMYEAGYLMGEMT